MVKDFKIMLQDLRTNAKFAARPLIKNVEQKEFQTFAFNKIIILDVFQ